MMRPSVIVSRLWQTSPHPATVQTQAAPWPGSLLAAERLISCARSFGFCERSSKLFQMVLTDVPGYNTKQELRNARSTLMPDMTLPTYALTGREYPAGAPASSEVRSSTQVAHRYDEVDLRLMDTFPASDAVARY
jgi:hypothetical protein